MAEESVTESDKEKHHSNYESFKQMDKIDLSQFWFWSPFRFPSASASRWFHLQHVFFYEWCFTFTFFVFNSISLSLFVVSNSTSLSLLTADSRILSLFPRWFKNMKEQLFFDLDDFSQEVQRGRVGGHFYHINIISPHAIPFFIWLDQSFYLFC